MFVRPGDTVRFLAFFQTAAGGLGKTGLTPTISVNEGTTNKVAVASATAMTALDATNQPGVYYYDHIVTATFFGAVLGQPTTSDTTCIVRSLVSLYFSVPWLPYIANGTASAGGATSITLAGANANDNVYNGQTVVILAGTGATQSRVITAYNGATKVATVSRAWAINPDSTSVFSVNPLGTVNLASILDVPVSTTTAQLGVNVVNIKGSVSAGAAGYVGPDWSAINAPTTAVNLSATNIDIDQVVASVSGAVNSVTSGVTLANNAITTAAINDGSIADDVWNGLAATYDTPNTMGEALNTASSGGSVPTVPEIADGVWDELLAGHLTTGSAGKALSDSGVSANPWTDTLEGYSGNQAGAILNRIGSGEVEINYDTPIKDGQLLQIVKGNDYVTDNGRVLKFDGSTWPDLSDAATKVWFGMKQRNLATILVLATIVEPSVNPKMVHVELPSTVTRNLTAPQLASIGAGQWELLAKIGTDQLATSLKQGLLIVLPQIVT